MKDSPLKTSRLGDLLAPARPATDPNVEPGVAPAPEPEPTPDPVPLAKPRETRRAKAAASPFRPYVPPVEEETVQLNVRIPKPLMARVKQLHKTTDEPIKGIVTRALEALCDVEER